MSRRGISEPRYGGWSRDACWTSEEWEELCSEGGFLEVVRDGAHSLAPRFDACEPAESRKPKPQYAAPRRRRPRRPAYVAPAWPEWGPFAATPLQFQLRLINEYNEAVILDYHCDDYAGISTATLERIVVQDAAAITGLHLVKRHN